MRKRDYSKPSITIVEMDTQVTVLAGSGDTYSVEMDNSGNDYDGAFYSASETLVDDSDD